MDSALGYRALADRIAHWLLHAPIVIAAGPATGAVAGWLTEQGAPAFAYPEITGYYLTWLAFLAHDTPACQPLALARATAAVAWLRSSGTPAGPPPTRLHLQPAAEPDWRNAAVFAFDLAMIARGLTHADQLLHCAGCAPVLQQYMGYLLDLVTPDCTLLPVRLIAGHDPAELPATWSTAPGAHHVKTAAALLAAPGGLSDAPRGFSAAPAALFAAPVAAAARKLLERWLPAPWAGLLRRPLHPLFYDLEGRVIFTDKTDAHSLAEVAAVYTAVLTHQDAAGGLPSVLRGPATRASSASLPRADVTAQALRLGSLLRAWGHLPDAAWDDRLAGLARRLATFVAPDGGVVQYQARGAPRQPNAWCSMFAHQAFVFYDALRQGRPLPAPAFDSALLV